MQCKPTQVNPDESSLLVEVFICYFTTTCYMIRPSFKFIKRFLDHDVVLLLINFGIVVLLLLIPAYILWRGPKQVELNADKEDDQFGKNLSINEKLKNYSNYSKNNLSSSNFPWLVEVIVPFKNNRNQVQRRCVGALAGDEWVLTSASCLLSSKESSSISYLRVAFSSNNETISLTAAKFYTHPNFSGSETWYDVALVRLEDAGKIRRQQTASLVDGCFCNRANGPSSGTVLRQNLLTDDSFNLKKWGQLYEPIIVNQQEVNFETCKIGQNESSRSEICLLDYDDDDGDASHLKSNGSALIWQTSGCKNGTMIISQQIIGFESWRHSSVYSSLCQSLPWLYRYLQSAKDTTTTTTRSRIKITTSISVPLTGREAAALFRAAGDGDLQLVEALVDAYNGSVKLRDLDGTTALTYAAINGHSKVVAFLIDRDSDVNVENNFGGTPLMYASWKGNIDVVRLLLDNGADINATDHDEWTALIYAIRKGHTDVVELLLDKGIDVNAIDITGRTALSYASELNFFGVVTLLKSRRAISASFSDSKISVNSTAGNSTSISIQLMATIKI